MTHYAPNAGIDELREAVAGLNYSGMPVEE